MNCRLPKKLTCCGKHDGIKGSSNTPPSRHRWGPLTGMCSGGRSAWQPRWQEPEARPGPAEPAAGPASASGRSRDEFGQQRAAELALEVGGAVLTRSVCHFPWYKCLSLTPTYQWLNNQLAKLGFTAAGRSGSSTPRGGCLGSFLILSPNSFNRRMVCPGRHVRLSQLLWPAQRPAQGLAKTRSSPNTY